ncbi:MAG: OmpA family protein [Bacteroidales bacterium]
MKSLLPIAAATLFLLLLAHPLQAQNQADASRLPDKTGQRLYQQGLSAFQGQQYQKAEELLLKLLDREPLYAPSLLLLAQMCQQDQRDSLAIDYFERAIASDATLFPPARFHLANLKRLSGNYQEALNHYRNYLEWLLQSREESTQKRGDQEQKWREEMATIERNMEHCRFAIAAMESPVPFNPIALPASVNDEFDQYWPSLSADANLLVYTSNRPIDPKNPSVKRNRQEDFFITTRSAEGWLPPVAMGNPINTPDNEGAQALSANGREMYFTACNRVDGYGRCDLYYSMLKRTGWSVPQNLGPPVNTESKESQPSLSADGEWLFFSSDRPGGRGGMDIWVSRKVNGSWQDPVPLGDSINTPWHETSPFIHPDGRSLYFASDGWPGMGRSDLFVAEKRADGLWMKAQNLGYPINTHREEMGLVVQTSGEKALFASARVPGKGLDLWEFELPRNFRPIPVKYEQERILSAAEQSTPLAQGITRIAPVRTGKMVVLQHIYFDVDKFTLRSESETELNQIVKLLKEQPSLRVRVHGHTDNTGTPEHNRILSEQRAEAVLSYLVKQGIDVGRLESEGHGDALPLGDNETESGRQENRRTEIEFMDGR